LTVLLQSILPFAGILLGLVVIHELGHYITAKIFGVRVLEAGIGLPPRIWGFTWHGTDYTINALPLGAFVRMLGEEDPNDPERKQLGEEVMLPDSLAAQPKWKRTIIISSGAVINLIAAVVLFSVGLMIPHPVSIGGAKIAMVAPNSPAQSAGLQEGDEILKVNGREADSTQRASYLLRLYQGSDIDLTLKRRDARDGSQVIEQSVYSRWNPKNYTDACGVEQTSGPIGIQIAPVSVAPVSLTAQEKATLENNSKDAWKEYKKDIAPGSPAFCYAGTDFGFRGLSAAQCSNLDEQSRAEAEALKADLFSESQDACFVFEPGPQYEALSKTEWEPPWQAIPDGTRLSYESLILFRNQIWSWVRGFVDPQVAGPVGIAQATGEVVHEAGWLSLINFAALLSMNLGVFNLLPLPMVDGGRLLFIFIEFIRGGRRIAPEKEALVHFMGFVAMILFAAVITYFDIARIINGGSLLR
jgi:regulator of sigma E protease